MGNRRSVVGGFMNVDSGRRRGAALEERGRKRWAGWTASVVPARRNTDVSVPPRLAASTPLIPTANSDAENRSVPLRALLLSCAALAIPLVAAYSFPEWTAGDGALLVWVPAVLPAFLLAFHRGWNGAALALAATMATLALSQAEILLLDLSPPRWEILLAIVGVMVAVCLGAGWMANSLHGERTRAEQAALTDALTGLPNRRHASVLLESHFGRAARGDDLAVVLFDLDSFKQVNDQHGHAEGDRVLRTFAELLKERTRRMDLSARWGGEEFLTVLVDADVQAAVMFAEELRASLAAKDFGWGQVTASAGVGAVEPGMGSPDVLVAAADRALYMAKDLGRDRVHRADQLLSGSRKGRLAKADDPVEGISLDNLRVLLVDDDPAVLRSTQRLLERLGCTVRAFGDPREALEMAAREPHPHAIVTDIIMPEMSGFTLVDLASRTVPHLRAIYMSGYPQEKVYWGGSPGARTVFLSKPIEVEELSEALELVLGAAQEPLDEEQVDVALSPARLDHAGGTDRAEDSPGTNGNGAAEGRILIVDDEPHVVSVLQRLFVQQGYEEPLTVKDPTQVPTVLEEEKVDLILLDLHMPQMDGFELMEQLPRHRAPSEFLPVLVLTGDTAPEVRRRALEAGAHDFLSKPFDVAEAQARVKNLLEARFLNQRVARQRDEMEARVRERTAELADTRSEILHRLARAAEYRDDVTGRHAERVGMLSSLLARELGFGHRDVDIVRRTAPLHDVGKIGVPDAILNKPGALTPSEFELMKTHTIIGEEILGGGRHRILSMAAEIARSHHERWDGGGYPDGLEAEEIPLPARIVAVADTFDTLSHNRPYKEAVSVEDALAEIGRCSGGHFDPRVVTAFQAICERVGSQHFTSLSNPRDPRSDIYSFAEA